MTATDIAIVNKKLRELQHELFMKERHLKERDVQVEDLERQVKKEK